MEDKLTKEEFYEQSKKIAEEKGQTPFNINDPLFEKIYNCYLLSNPGDKSLQNKLSGMLRNRNNSPVWDKSSISDNFMKQLLDHGTFVDKTCEFFTGPFDSGNVRKNISVLLIRASHEGFTLKVHFGFVLRKKENGRGLFWSPHYWLMDDTKSNLYESRKTVGLDYFGIPIKNEVNFIAKSLDLSVEQVNMIL